MNSDMNDVNSQNLPNDLGDNHAMVGEASSQCPDQTESANKSEELSSCLDGVGELREQIKTIEERLQDFEQWQKGFEQKQQEKCPLFDEATKAIDEVKELWKKLENYDSFVSSTKNACDKIDSKKSDVDRRISTLKKKIGEICDEQVKPLRTKIESQDQAISKLQEDVASLQASCEEKEKAITSLTNELWKTTKVNSSLGQKCDKLDSKVQHLESSLKEARSRLADRFLIVKLLGQLFVPPTYLSDDTLSDSGAILDNRNIESMSQAFTAGRLDNYLKSFQNHIENQISNATRDFNNGSAGIKATVAELQKRMDGLKHDIDGKANKDNMENGLKSVQREINTQLSNAIGDFNNNHASLKNELNELKNTLKHVEDKQRSIEDSCSASANEMEQIKRDIRNLAADRVVKEDIETCVNDIRSEVQKEFVGVKDEFLEMKKQIEGAVDKVDSAVKNVSHQSTDAKNSATAMVENFKKMIFSLKSISENADNDEFDDWSIEYVGKRLIGEPELPEMNGGQFQNEVRKVKDQVRQFLAENSTEDFRRAFGKSFAACVICPQEGDAFDASIHEGYKRPKRGEELDYVVKYVESIGLLLPNCPTGNIKAKVDLKKAKAQNDEQVERKSSGAVQNHRESGMEDGCSSKDDTGDEKANCNTQKVVGDNIPNDSGN